MHVIFCKYNAFCLYNVEKRKMNIFFTKKKNNQCTDIGDKYVNETQDPPIIEIATSKMTAEVDPWDILIWFQ